MPVKHIMTALALFLINTCSAQTSVLNRYYDWGTGPRYLNFWDVMYTGDSLTILGEIGDTSIPQQQNAFIARLDTMGNLGTLKYYYDPLGYSQNLNSEYVRLTRTADSGYIFTTTPFFRPSNTILYKLNKSLGIEFISEFPLNEDVVFSKNIIETDDAYYLGFDLSTRQGDDNDYCVVKTDKQGNKLWHRLYGLPDRREALYVMKSFKEGEIQLYGNKNGLIGNIMTIDTSGAVIRDLEFTSDVGIAVCDFDTLSGGDYIRLGFQFQDFSGWISTSSVHRIDSTGREIWARVQGWSARFNRTNRMLRNMDGSYTAIGMEKQNDTIRAKAFRITQDGDILWQSYFPGATNTTINYFRAGLRGMTMLPGGNIIACGSITDFKDNWVVKGYLVKIQPDGCIDTLCSTLLDTDGPLVNKNEKITVWPNPARDALYVTIPAASAAMRLALSDLYGRPVQSHRLTPGENRITIGSQVTPGVYIYTISGRGGSISAGKIVILK